MDRQPSLSGRLSRLIWRRRAAAAPYHGLLIFAGQILLVLLVPLFDHGEASTLELGTYRLAENLEGASPPRWVDFLWLSFSTLTTAGFGDLSPVGAWPCAIATLEGRCGILYPATLIARIASLPAPGESGKCW